MTKNTYDFPCPAVTLRPIGYVVREPRAEDKSISALRSQPVRIVIDPEFEPGLLGINPGRDLLVLYYMHGASGNTLQVHPRGDRSRPLRGVFDTRSPVRPNPIGVTTVQVQQVTGNVIEVLGLDALDSSPVLDIKHHSTTFDQPYGEGED